MALRIKHVCRARSYTNRPAAITAVTSAANTATMLFYKLLPNTNNAYVLALLVLLLLLLLVPLSLSLLLTPPPATTAEGSSDSEVNKSDSKLPEMIGLIETLQNQLTRLLVS